MNFTIISPLTIRLAFDRSRAKPNFIHLHSIISPSIPSFTPISDHFNRVIVVRWVGMTLALNILEILYY